MIKILKIMFQKYGLSVTVRAALLPSQLLFVLALCEIISKPPGTAVGETVGASVGDGVGALEDAGARQLGNFRRLVLGCIDSYDSEQRRIFLHFSRSTRLSSRISNYW